MRILMLCLILASCSARRSGDALQARLDSAYRRAMLVYRLPGLAVGVIKGGKVVYARGFGVLKLGGTDSVTTASSFHMASVSKPFVSLALLQLVDEGRVVLDSPLTRYIPYFRMKDARYTEITLRQMLAHRSGFPDVRDYHWDKPEYDDGALERYIRDSVSTDTLLFAPGTRWAYSNMAYDVLAEVIHRVSGVPFETYMKEHIFQPCGMDNSTFLVRDVPPALATSPHVLGKSGHFEVSPVYPYTRAHAGSSTLHSSVDDMLRWEDMVLQKGWCDSLSFFTDDWNGKKLVNHSGADLGYSSYVGFIPKDTVAIVFMCNLHRYAPYEVLTNIALDGVYGYPMR